MTNHDRDKSYPTSLEASLTDPAEAAAYIDAVKAQNDDAALVLALRHVANAQSAAEANTQTAPIIDNK